MEQKPEVRTCEASMRRAADVCRTFAEQVRRTWATGLLNKQWGRNVLLRVWFRKTRGADYEPTKEDLADATANIKDIRKSMTEEEIIDAYTRGEEVCLPHAPSC